MNNILIIGSSNIFHQLLISSISKLLYNNNPTIMIRYISNVDQFEFLDVSPDLVLVIDAIYPKLWDIPTYGVMIRTTDYFKNSRLVRNILSYDGYLYDELCSINLLEDLLFSARLQYKPVMLYSPFSYNSKIARSNFSSLKIAYYTNSKSFFSRRFMANFSKKYNILCFGNNAKIYSKYYVRVPLLVDKIRDMYSAAGMALVVDSDFASKEEARFFLRLAISSGVLVVTNFTDDKQLLFGDSLIYFKGDKFPSSGWISRLFSFIKSHSNLVRKEFNILQNKLHYRSIDISISLNDLLQRTSYNFGLTDQPVWANKSVSYIMRTGGNPKYIFRAIDSLVAQTVGKITLLLVLYKPLVSLKMILEKYSGLLNIRIIEDFGQLRSTGIVTGMKHVTTDYFGMLDDDDFIHRNHLVSLFRILECYNRPPNSKGAYQVAYSGSYCCSNLMKFKENPVWHDLKIDTDPRYRVVEHFQFYDAHRMSKHLWYMMSNAWIADSSLIDEELLRDPQTNSSEDIYFELQFAMKTFFAFSCEMTAVHWFDGANSSIVDSFRHDADYFRHSLALHLRSFPDGRFYRSKFCSENSAITSMDVNAFSLYENSLPPLKMFTIKKLMLALRGNGPRYVIKRCLWHIYNKIHS